MPASRAIDTTYAARAGDCKAKVELRELEKQSCSGFDEQATKSVAMYRYHGGLRDGIVSDQNNSTGSFQVPRIPHTRKNYKGTQQYVTL